MTTLRVKTRDVVEQVYYADMVYIVKAYGRSMVAIVSLDRFATMREGEAISRESKRIRAVQISESREIEDE